MHFRTLFFATLTSLVAAQSGTCFDDGDCILNGGGHCIKSGMGLDGLLGKCAPKGASTLTTSVKPTGTAAPGQGTCFDDGDCLLYKNTTCQKKMGMITG